MIILRVADGYSIVYHGDAPMTESTPESLTRRIEVLEKKLAEPPATPNDWASVVGMFDADPELMQQIIADAAAAREAERQTASEESA